MPAFCFKFFSAGEKVGEWTFAILETRWCPILLFAEEGVEEKALTISGSGWKVEEPKRKKQKTKIQKQEAKTKKQRAKTEKENAKSENPKSKEQKAESSEQKAK